MSGLFEDLPEQRRERSKASARPRVLEADRRQVALEAVCLDDLLAPEHPARAVWAFVEGLDLAPLYAAIRASEDRAAPGGRQRSEAPGGALALRHGGRCRQRAGVGHGCLVSTWPIAGCAAGCR